MERAEEERSPLTLSSPLSSPLSLALEWGKQRGKESGKERGEAPSWLQKRDGAQSKRLVDAFPCVCVCVFVCVCVCVCARAQVFGSVGQHGA